MRISANNANTVSRYSSRIRAICDYSGFTLIEVVLVVAILAIAGTFATFGFTNVRKPKELEHDARAIVAYLRDAQQRSITGADGAMWEVDFTNVIGGDDYFDLIPSGGSSAAHVALRPSVEIQEFRHTTNPSAPAGELYQCPPEPQCAFAVIFASISGRVVPGENTAPYAIVVRTKGETCPGAACRTITVDANGLITY